MARTAETPRASPARRGGRRSAARSRRSDGAAEAEPAPSRCSRRRRARRLGFGGLLGRYGLDPFSLAFIGTPSAAAARPCLSAIYPPGLIGSACATPAHDRDVVGVGLGLVELEVRLDSFDRSSRWRRWPAFSASPAAAVGTRFGRSKVASARAKPRTAPPAGRGVRRCGWSGTIRTGPASSHRLIEPVGTWSEVAYQSGRHVSVVARHARISEGPPFFRQRSRADCRARHGNARTAPGRPLYHLPGTAAARRLGWPALAGDHEAKAAHGGELERDRR